MNYQSLSTSLESHMFLKEKWDRSLNRRTVAGGNKQWEYISKEDVSSPTVATEAILLLCIIDAKEERDVTVINIPNVFIQMRVEHKEDDMAIIKIHGVLVDILIQIAPNVYKSMSWLIRKGWNSYWYSARMPYMVQWLQAYCTIANSPRVWQVLDSQSTHTIHA